MHGLDCPAGALLFLGAHCGSCQVFIPNVTDSDIFLENRAGCLGCLSLAFLVAFSVSGWPEMVRVVAFLMALCLNGR